MRIKDGNEICSFSIVGTLLARRRGFLIVAGYTKDEADRGERETIEFEVVDNRTVGTHCVAWQGCRLRWYNQKMTVVTYSRWCNHLAGASVGTLGNITSARLANTIQLWLEHSIDTAIQVWPDTDSTESPARSIREMQQKSDVQTFQKA